MKVFELLESDDWENDSFTTNVSEIVHLERKIKDVVHQRVLLFAKLKTLSAPDGSSSVDLKPINHTGGAEANYATYYARPGDPRVLAVTRELDKTLILSQQYNARIKELTIKGQTFCFTGFRDAAMEDKIIAQGGKVASGISRHVDCLVAADPAERSGKISKAKEYDIRVMSRQKMAQILRS